VNGRSVQVVSPGYLKEQGLEARDQRLDALAAEGKTVVFVLLDGRPAGPWPWRMWSARSRGRRWPG